MYTEAKEEEMSSGSGTQQGEPILFCPELRLIRCFQMVLRDRMIAGFLQFRTLKKGLIEAASDRIKISVSPNTKWHTVHCFNAK